MLHLPRPGRRESGLPSPVLKLAWQRRQTYIFELDIIGLTPGSPDGRAATYSACVWRSLREAFVAEAAGAEVGAATAGPLDGEAERRAVMGGHLMRVGGPRMQDACAVRGGTIVPVNPIVDTEGLPCPYGAPEDALTCATRAGLVAAAPSGG